MGIILGTLGNDSVLGTDGIDIITTLSGNDEIQGRNGADIIDGGDGDDTIYAGSRAAWSDGAIDTVLGGGGDDHIFGAYGDILNGGFGTDSLSIDLSSATSGLDIDFRPMTLLDVSDLLVLKIGTTQLSGFQAVAEVRGTEWADKITVGNRDHVGSVVDGGAGDDILRAGMGDDVVIGGDGNDRLTGLRGKDVLEGGTGNDRLSGGHSRDDLTGGLGADTFVFAERDSAAQRGRADTIHDFSLNQGDHISLRSIDAIAGGSDDAFSFIGDSRFSGTAGELRFVHVDGATFVSGDTNGDAKADFTIKLDGEINLAANDFTL